MTGIQCFTDEKYIPVCGAMTKVLTMDSKGNYNFCEGLQNYDFFAIGNYDNMSILDAWNSEKIEKILFPDKSVFSDTCQKCKYISWCRSGCFQNKMDKGLKPYDRDPYCRIKC